MDNPNRNLKFDIEDGFNIAIVSKQKPIKSTVIVCVLMLLCAFLILTYLIYPEINNILHRSNEIRYGNIIFGIYSIYAIVQVVFLQVNTMEQITFFQNKVCCENGKGEKLILPINSIRNISIIKYRLHSAIFFDIRISVIVTTNLFTKYIIYNVADIKNCCNVVNIYGNNATCLKKKRLIDPCSLHLMLFFVLIIICKPTISL